MGQFEPTGDISLSAAQSVKDAPRNREIVAKRMSRDEVIEGQRRAAAFVPKKTTSTQAGEFQAKAMPSSTGDQPKGSATGFFITKDGYLVSNFHVVADAVRIKVRTKEGELPAQVIRTTAIGVKSQHSTNDSTLGDVAGKRRFSWLVPRELNDQVRGIT